ncbi:MAG: hypothetical protein L0H63_08485 [Nitrococcus sp.]|nr:hypothetical protein [Nitrococcus sp.]
MKRRRVLFTTTAKRHVQREQKWWAADRDHTEIFAAELESAIRIVSILPGAGALYPDAGIPGLRRLYIPKVACHLYYTYLADKVIVRALWGRPWLTEGVRVVRQPQPVNCSASYAVAWAHKDAAEEMATLREVDAYNFREGSRQIQPANRLVG